jgi:hypothetical protein
LCDNRCLVVDQSVSFTDKRINVALGRSMLMAFGK